MARYNTQRSNLKIIPSFVSIHVIKVKAFIVYFLAKLASTYPTNAVKVTFTAVAHCFNGREIRILNLAKYISRNEKYFHGINDFDYSWGTLQEYKLMTVASTIVRVSPLPSIKGAGATHLKSRSAGPGKKLHRGCQLYQFALPNPTKLGATDAKAFCIKVTIYLLFLQQFYQRFNRNTFFIIIRL